MVFVTSERFYKLFGRTRLSLEVTSRLAMIYFLILFIATFGQMEGENQECNVLTSRKNILTEGINQIKPGYWIRLNRDRPVCFQTRGNSPGIIRTPYDGFVGALKLVYLYGSISCDRSSFAYNSYWGCQNHPVKRSDNLNIYLTDKKSNQILSNRKDATFNWYSNQMFTPISKEFIFNSIRNPHYVYEGYEIQLWYGDDKMDRGEDRSKGETCVDVYAHFV